MIASVRGALLDARPAAVTIEVGGVGLDIFIPERSAATLPPVGSEVRLYTHLHVRETALELFGFCSADERSIFRALIGVSGIGPRTALAILSRLSADEIVAALRSGDVAAFCRAPGVGRKTAQRLMVDLAERFDLSQVSHASGAQVAAAHDAVQALVTLGYPDVKARKAVADAQARLGGDIDAGELIRAALRGLVDAR